MPVGLKEYDPHKNPMHAQMEEIAKLVNNQYFPESEDPCSSVTITEKQAQVVRNLLAEIQESDQQIGGSKGGGLNPHYVPCLECGWIDRMAKEWENIL